MFKSAHQYGYLLGGGAAANVECGFVPDFVRVVNVTDGTVINHGYPGSQLLGFDSGSTEIKVRDKLVGATSSAKAIVKQVILTSGSWAGGDAAGYLEVDPTTVSGTWADNEEIDVWLGDTDKFAFKDADNVATVNGTLITPGNDIDTEVAADAGITAYGGSDASAPKGFTLAAGIMVSAKLIRWDAMSYSD